MPRLNALTPGRRSIALDETHPAPRNPSDAFDHRAAAVAELVENDYLESGRDQLDASVRTDKADAADNQVGACWRGALAPIGVNSKSDRLRQIHAAACRPGSTDSLIPTAFNTAKRVFSVGLPLGDNAR